MRHTTVLMPAVPNASFSLHVMARHIMPRHVVPRHRVVMAIGRFCNFPFTALMFGLFSMRIRMNVFERRRFWLCGSYFGMGMVIM